LLVSPPPYADTGDYISLSGGFLIASFMCTNYTASEDKDI